MSPINKIECLYDKDTLSFWGKRYPENIEWNFNNLILQRLTPDELAALHGVRLEFPLVAPGDVKSDPIVFYSYQHPPTVTLPIYSVKFLDDISIAAAWLECNGFSLETIFDYISFLKYANPVRLPGGRFPEPFKALSIPKDVLDNKSVDDLSQKILKSSLVWILAHELGHILYRHPSYAEMTIAESQATEKEADAFATEMFRRIGVVPAGMVLFFTVLIHWLLNRGDFSSDSAWEEYVKGGTTHPVSTERLKAISSEIKSNPDGFTGAEPNADAARKVALNIAMQIEQITDKLLPSVQQLIRARALTVTLDALQPRRLGEIDIYKVNQAVDFDETLPFNGIYHGLHTRKLEKGGTESLDCCLLLDRKGDTVSGRFNFGVGEGTIEGHIAGEELYFDWQWGNALGKGIFQQKSLKEFTGNWGYKDNKENGGTWTGTRY